MYGGFRGVGVGCVGGAGVLACRRLRRLHGTRVRHVRRGGLRLGGCAGGAGVGLGSSEEGGGGAADAFGVGGRCGLLLGDGVEGGQGALPSVGGEGGRAEFLGFDQGLGGLLEVVAGEDEPQIGDGDGVPAADIQGGDAWVEQVVEQFVRELVCVHGPKVAGCFGDARGIGRMTVKQRTGRVVSETF